jgi:hypothetical protein
VSKFQGCQEKFVKVAGIKAKVYWLCNHLHQHPWWKEQHSYTAANKRSESAPKKPSDQQREIAGNTTKSIALHKDTAGKEQSKLQSQTANNALLWQGAQAQV